MLNRIPFNKKYQKTLDPFLKSIRSKLFMAPRKTKRAPSPTVNNSSSDESEPEYQEIECLETPTPKPKLTVIVTTKDPRIYQIQKLWNTLVNMMDELPEVSEEQANEHPDLHNLYMQVYSLWMEFQDKIENSSFAEHKNIFEQSLDELIYITESTDPNLVMTLRMLLLRLQKEAKTAKSNSSVGIPTTSMQSTIVPYLTEVAGVSVGNYLSATLVFLSHKRTKCFQLRHAVKILLSALQST